MNRVVITGIGLVTSLGTGTEATWEGLIAGRTGIDRIQGFDVSSLCTQLGGEVRDFEPRQYVANRRALRKMTHGDQLALIGATLAVRDAHLELGEEDADVAGLFVGGNKDVSDLDHLLQPFLEARGDNGVVDIQRFGESAQTTAYPLFFVEGLQAASLFHISEAFKLRGANTYFAGTAESGALAVGRGYRAVRTGEAKVVIAGGFDDTVSWWPMTKYDSTHYLTDRNELGAAAYCPYDVQRSGSLLGDGAAFVVLETYADAVARGARMYAEVTGMGNANDATELGVPHPEGRGLSHAIQSALREAGSEPAQVGYIAAEGNGTKLGDASETAGIRSAFGPAAERVVASSVKPAVGNMMAGAGALNVGVAALSLYHQIVPPTLHLKDLDPACSLDWVPEQTREVRIDNALAVARGLEGQNVVLALRAVR